VAASSHLAYVDPSTNHAIIKVDNTSTVPYNQKRNTVRISTNDKFSVGSVWTVDMLHVPYGVRPTHNSTRAQINILLRSAPCGRRGMLEMYSKVELNTQHSTLTLGGHKLQLGQQAGKLNTTILPIPVAKRCVIF
jgi:hypothetical protein